ncbi:MAG: glycosyltransferase family 2 protein [Bacteroidaceae bacterium]|nr:glycosyltransferase family 2 protein [Bacteroidaceae bacterium]
MVEGLVSIITTLYDSGDFIGRTIESVLAQTYTNWEMIITDDCSKDNGPSIVESYVAKDTRIRLIRLEKNGGPGVARNISIQNSKGRYIAFLDSDDLWSPDKLERQLELMDSTGCGVVYSSYYTCDEKDHITGLVKCRSRIPYWRIVCDNAIGFLTMMYDTKATGIELLPEIRKRQDWGLNIKLLRKCRVAYGIKYPLASYRIRHGSVSSGKFSLIKFNVEIYRQVLEYSRNRALLTFLFVFLPFYFGKKLLNFFKTLFFRQR